MNDNIRENLEEDIEDEKDNKAPIIIGLVVLFLLIVSALAYFSASSIKPPENLQAVVEGNNVVLLWDASKSNEVIGYNVYRSIKKGELGEKLNSKPVKDLTYKDKNLKEGTYYYVVRATTLNNKEDSNMNQVEVSIGNVPYGLSMVLGNGKGYSNTNRVSVRITAENAEQCRFSVDGVPLDWFEYKQSTSVYVGEGKHKVSLQCRNKGGLSEEISQYVVVDTSEPLISMNLLDQNEKSIKVILTIEDEDELECLAYAGDKLVDSFSAFPGEMEKNFDIVKGKYDFKLVCKDKAGNEGIAILPIDNLDEVEDNETKPLTFSVLINGGDSSTTSRSVLVEVKGESIESCRYTNENLYPEYKTDWITYKRIKEWTLSPGKGKKIVYVECIGKNGEIKEESDSIYYTSNKKSGGDSNSGNSGNSNTNSSNSTNSSAYIYETTYFYVDFSGIHTLENGESINSRYVGANIMVENAFSCKLFDEYDGNKYVINETNVSESNIVLTGVLKSEGPHKLYVACYDSSNIPVYSPYIVITYTSTSLSSPTADSLEIVGFVRRGNALVENNFVTAVSDVVLKVKSSNADYGKEWNTPYVDSKCGTINMPGIVDDESEAEWNSNVNGNINFKLIPSSYYYCNGNHIKIKDGVREVNFKVKNELGESSTISSTIFYDSTSPKLYGIKAVAIVLNSSSSSNVQLTGVKLIIDAKDNGDEYGVGLNTMLIKRFKCDSIFNSCELQYSKVVPYSKEYYDYPLASGYYKYDVKVYDMAGYHSALKSTYVNISTQLPNLDNVTIYYIKGNEKYELEQGTAINSQELVAYVYGISGTCELIDVLYGNSYVIGESSGNSEIVVGGKIKNITAEHKVFVRCSNSYSEPITFYYDSINPRVSAFSKPYFKINPKNKTAYYSVKLFVSASDNYQLSKINITYNAIIVNTTCLKRHNYSINERPYLLTPFRFRKIFDCISVEKNKPFVYKQISGREYSEKFELSQNLSLSTKYIRYFYVFKVYVEDSASNNATTYSNPIFSHKICYRNYNNRRYKFCYMPEEYNAIFNYFGRGN